MTRFVILAVPRTGSNLLCTLLNSHPEILCHHEVFNPDGIFTALCHRDAATDVTSLRERDRDPLGFLDRLWRTGREDCIGFKWTRGQNELVLRAVLGDPAINKIVLRRQNRIKTYVSEKIAQQTQQWEVYRGQHLAMPRPRVSVDRTDLLNHIAVNEQCYADIEASLKRMNQPRIDVLYETLFAPAEQLRILEYLGVHARAPAADTGKQSGRIRWTCVIRLRTSTNWRLACAALALNRNCTIVAANIGRSQHTLRICYNRTR